MNRAWSAPFLDEWSRAIMDFFAGDRDEPGLLKLAATDKERLCEAYYYIAAIRRAQGNSAGARRYLQRCVDQKVTNFTEHKSAVIELRQK
jgi:lipoprotein NlpI